MVYYLNPHNQILFVRITISKGDDHAKGKSKTEHSYRVLC